MYKIAVRPMHVMASIKFTETQQNLHKLNYVASTRANRGRPFQPNIGKAEISSKKEQSSFTYRHQFW